MGETLTHPGKVQQHAAEQTSVDPSPLVGKSNTTLPLPAQALSAAVEMQIGNLSASFPDKPVVRKGPSEDVTGDIRRTLRPGPTLVSHKKEKRAHTDVHCSFI